MHISCYKWEVFGLEINSPGFMVWAIILLSLKPAIKIASEFLHIYETESGLYNNDCDKSGPECHM